MTVAKYLDYIVHCSSRNVAVLPLSYFMHAGWTKTETIDSLMRKSGYMGPITESLRKRVRITRYQSTLYTMHYSDYVTFVKKTRGAAPLIGTRPYH
jgi:hypothetical protein